MKLNFKICINYLFSLLLASSIILTYYALPKGLKGTKFLFNLKINLVFFLSVFILSLFIFVILTYLLKIITKYSFKEDDNLFNTKKVQIISFILIFIFGTIFLLVYYPGTAMVDTLYLIYDPVKYSRQYPLLYSLLFSNLFYTINFITNNMNLSFFLLGILQLIYMDSVITYVISWVHKKFQNNNITIFLIIYFSLNPIVSNYNTTIARDSISASLFLLIIPFLYDIISSSGKKLSDKIFLIKLSIIMGLITIVRNNGIFTITILVFAIIIIYKKYFKTIIKLALIVTIIFMIPRLLPSSYKSEPLFQESVGVPIQQLAFLAKYNKLDDSDLKEISKVIPSEVIKEVYNPFFVDNIKWHGYFDRKYLNKNKNTYIKMWNKYLFKYPSDYVKILLLNSFDLWGFDKFYQKQSVFFEIDLTDEVISRRFGGLENIRILPDGLYKELNNFYRSKTIFFSSSVCFFISLFLGVVMINKKKKEFLLILVPCLALWLNLMIATPLSCAFRYMCPYLYCLPLFGVITFSNSKK